MGSTPYLIDYVAYIWYYCKICKLRAHMHSYASLQLVLLQQDVTQTTVFPTHGTNAFPSGTAQASCILYPALTATDYQPFDRVSSLTNCLRKFFLWLHLRKKMLPYSLGRFQWAAALLLGLLVRMPPGHGCLCLACFQAEVVQWADHSSRGVILTAVCSVWSRSLKNEADLARVGLLRLRKYMFSYFAFS